MEEEINYSQGIHSRNSETIYKTIDKIICLREKLKEKSFEELEVSKNRLELSHLENILQNMVFTGEEVLEIIEYGGVGDYEKLKNDYDGLYEDYEKLKLIKEKYEKLERTLGEYESIGEDNVKLIENCDKLIEKVEKLKEYKNKISEIEQIINPLIGGPIDEIKDILNN